jgi:hypothetical protein
MIRKIDFETWCEMVDSEIYRLCGLGRDALPDWDYWSAWEDGVTVTAAARRVIRAAREY